MRFPSFLLTLTVGAAASLAACQSETRRSVADAPPSVAAQATVAPSVELPSSVVPEPTSAPRQVAAPPSFALAPAPSSVQRSTAAPKSDFLRRLAKPSQWFELNPARDTIMRFAEGGSLRIPARALRTRGGLPAGPVKLEVREYYSTADIVLNRLSTTAQGRLLETGGMVYLAATAGTESCEVAPGAKLTLQLPARRGAPAMELFQGRPDSRGIVDWVAVGQPIDPPKAAKVETMAEFPGGNGELMSQLYRSVLYPALALRREEQGRVLIRFIVTETGAVTHPKVKISSGSELLDTAGIASVRKLPRFKPATTDGIPVASYFEVPIDFIIDEFANEDVKHSKSWKKSWENSLTAAFDSTLARESASQLSSYVITLGGLGWINCDRFLNSKQPKINFAVADIKKVPTQVFLVFTETNSMMASTWRGGKYWFDRVPLGAKATLVAFAEAKTGALLATKPVQLTGDTERELTYRPITVAGLRQAIAAVK
jgi:TonB family protein